MPAKKMKVITTAPAENIFFAEETVKMNTFNPEVEFGVVNIYDDVKYQSVLGFGAALTEAAAYNYSLMDEKTKKEFIKLYFDTKDGIAYNFGRTHINSCDFALDIYTYVKEGDKTLESFDISRDKKYVIPFIKDILAYCEQELVLFASPWSPPAYMKENETMIKGGKLKEEYKAVWAKYYAKYIKAFAKEGIKIAAISVQNEPKAIQTWESCYYTGEDEAEFLEKYLIPALDEENLSDIKIIIWDHNKERVYDRAKTTLKNKSVRDRVWAVGYHWYSGDHFDGLRLVHEKIKKPLISTEFCATIKGDVNEIAERYGKEMCENFNNFQTGSCDWNILLSKDGGPFHNRTDSSKAEPGVIFDDTEGGCYAPILYDKDKGKMIVTPIYYYIGHFSKFIKRGAKRLAVTKYSDKLNVTAFRNPDKSTVVQIINSAEIDMKTIIRYRGKCTELYTKPHSITTLVF